MAELLDPRVLRLGVQIGDEYKVFGSEDEEYDISVTGTKYANSNFGDAVVTISNLEKSARTQLLTETAPYNRHRVIKRIFLDVGRKSTGAARFFQGDIIRTEVSQPPDIKVTIHALTGLFYATDIVARAGGPSIQLSKLANQIATDLSLSLDFQATDKLVANYNYIGGSLHQLRKLNDVGGIHAFIDGETLCIMDVGTPRKDKMRVLSRDNGMIGIPEILEHGIRVKMLWDNETAVGGAIQVVSDYHKAAEGVYVIYKLGFELATRAQPFYLIAEAARLSPLIQ